MFACVHAGTGIELLLKGWAMREHWAFAFDDLDRANTADLASGKLKSATPDQCLARLEKVGRGFTKAERKAFDRLKTIRNHIVHFSTNRLTDIEILGPLVESLGELMDTIEQRCEAAAFSEEDQTLRVLRAAVGSVPEYARARARAIAVRLSALGDNVFHCPRCGEVAVDITSGRNVCLFCLEVFHDSEIMDAHHDRALGLVAAERDRDYGFCPDCLGSAGKRWPDTHRVFCFGCAETFELDELVVCVSCGEWRRRDRDCKRCTIPPTATSPAPGGC
jgi:hypothetical protein